MSPLQPESASSLISTRLLCAPKRSEHLYRRLAASHRLHSTVNQLARLVRGVCDTSLSCCAFEIRSRHSGPDILLVGGKKKTGLSWRWQARDLATQRASSAA